MWTSWGQSSGHTGGRLKRWRLFLGFRRRRGRVRTGLVTCMVCVGVVGLLAGAAWSAVHYTQARTRDARITRALRLATTQLAELRSSSGLAMGMDCFDMTGQPHSATDAGAPCSYNPQGNASGCLGSLRVWCYMVRVTTTSNQGMAHSAATLVTYTSTVTWGVHQKVALVYRLVQTNQAYDVQSVTTVSDAVSSSEANAKATNVTTAPTVAGAINRLADISGGPSVSVGVPACKTNDSCYGAAGHYRLSSTFTVVTNVPDKLIVGCSWDYGDGSGVQLAAGRTGCDNGQVMHHDYQNAWQLQNVPPFPQACFAPLGSGVDTHIFLVRVTLHTTEGVDITSSAPLRNVMPSCAP